MIRRWDAPAEPYLRLVTAGIDQLAGQQRGAGEHDFVAAGSWTGR